MSGKNKAKTGLQLLSNTQNGKNRGEREREREYTTNNNFHKYNYRRDATQQAYGLYYNAQR